MNKRLSMVFGGILLAASACFAQNTLNIHQKDGSVVSYGFAEKPVVTYTKSRLHLSTKKVEMDYPIDNLEKFTFSDEFSTNIEQLRTVGTSDDIRIYDTHGRLVKTIRQSDATVSFSTFDIPKGIYIIKNGTTTYKITKR